MFAIDLPNPYDPEDEAALRTVEGFDDVLFDWTNPVGDDDDDN